MSAELVEQLNAIRGERGSLTPALVVEAASAPDHPLHAHFEWDDSAAAHQWRLSQASQLLRVTFRPNPDQPQHLRAFAAVRGEDTPTSEYVPIEEALADPFTRELLLRQMKRDWQTFKRRYDHMAEFASFVTDQVRGKSA